jgi:hypothetical protein
MDADLKERWNQMFVQAEEFDAVGKPEEGRARARLALSEIKAAHDSTTDPSEVRELTRFLRRAERYVEEYDESHAKWQAEVLERQKKFLEREEKAYHAPLPVPPHTHRG